jgi:hypothetical protein
MENENQKKLDELPPSSDKYWEFSDRYAREMKPNECVHNFEYKDSNAQCTKCGFGLFIDDRDEIKEGHLYRDGKLII